MPEVTRAFDIAVPVEETWEFFMTPERMAPCVPGCESFEQIEEDVFDAEILVEVAYTSLTFDAHIEITDKEPPNFAVVEAEASPSGRMPGSATVDGELELADGGDGTTDGEITIEFAIRGRLGSLGESAFKHQCENLTDSFLDNARAELEGAEATTE
jgi:carbon monoxide dehydrogenase subunit G